MAKEYHSDNTSDVVLEKALSEHSKVVVSVQTSPSGIKETVDIRVWYNTSSDSTWKPTQKGVRLGVDTMKEVINVLLNKL